MTKILCAIRGGEESFKTQDAAITLAQELGAELVFLFIVDTAFMDKTERAKNQGVKSSLLIRHGDFQTELIEVAKDSAIDTLFLGKPSGEESFFSLDELERFAQEVESETKAEVIFVK